jgi:hypothetical protein
MSNYIQQVRGSCSVLTCDLALPRCECLVQEWRLAVQVSTALAREADVPDLPADFILLVDAANQAIFMQVQDCREADWAPATLAPACSMTARSRKKNTDISKFMAVKSLSKRGCQGRAWPIVQACCQYCSRTDAAKLLDTACCSSQLTIWS